MSDEYTHLFGGSEDLQAVRLPDDQGRQFWYAVGDLFGPVGFFRYDDGWRWAHRPYTTIDVQRLMSDDEWRQWDDELGTTPGLTRQLLDAARAS